MDQSTLILIASFVLVALGAVLGIEIGQGDAILVLENLVAAVVELLGLFGFVWGAHRRGREAEAKKMGRPLGGWGR